MTSLVNVLVLTAYSTATLGLLLYGLNCYVMLVLCLRRKRTIANIRTEAASPDAVMTEAEALPIVTTQIAIFNELNVSERIIRAACTKCGTVCRR